MTTYVENPICKVQDATHWIVSSWGSITALRGSSFLSFLYQGFVFVFVFSFSSYLQCGTPEIRKGKFNKPEGV